MKNLLVWIMCASLIAYSSAGCSLSAMNKKPPPIHMETLKENPTRGELITLFGEPQHSEVVHEKRTDYFKFIDGYHGSTKLRGLFYVAGCVFTLCLSELVFWPLEENTMIGQEGKAIATYDDDNVAQQLEIFDEEGNPWDVNWRTASAKESGGSGEEF